MACDVQSVETLAYADGLAALSDRDFLICLAGVFLGNAGINAQTAITNAAANGYTKMSDLQLDQALLAVFTAAAIDAQTLVNTIATQKDDAIDRCDCTLAQVAAYCAGTMSTAQAIETLLCANGYHGFCRFDAIRGLLAVCSSSPLIGALDWAARVVQNGGAAPSGATITAIQTFLTSIASIRSKIYHLNVIAPDSIIAMRTPLIRDFGYGVWVPVTVGTGAPEILNTGGWQSYVDASNGTLYDIGVNPSLIPSFNIGNGGMSLYEPEAVVPSFQFQLGGSITAAVPRFQMGIDGPLILGQIYDTGSKLQIVHGGAAGGFLMCSRTAINVLTAYFANSGNAWASVGSSAVANSALPPNLNMASGGVFVVGSGYFLANQRLSFMAVHDGLSSAEGQILFNAVQALRTSFGGGFI